MSDIVTFKRRAFLRLGIARLLVACHQSDSMASAVSAARPRRLNG